MSKLVDDCKKFFNGNDLPPCLRPGKYTFGLSYEDLGGKKKVSISKEINQDKLLVCSVKYQK